MILTEFRSPDETECTVAMMSDRTGIAEILIVDRHPVTRLGLSTLIDGQPDMHVVGQPSDTSDALQTVHLQRPDLVVLEVSLKAGNGMELIQRICCPPAETRVLAVSLYDEKVYAPRALQAGASGYVSKDEDCETILNAIRGVLQGHAISKAPQQPPIGVDAGEIEGRDIRSLLTKLTDRELEVFELLGHGLTVQQIATRLSVTSNTVESYRERIKKKLRMKSGTELTVCAAQWVMET